jgi:hypothetical protein
MGIMRIYLLILVSLLQGVLDAHANPPIFKSKSPADKTYKVVLMLPFCIGMSDKAKIRDIMAEYYEGVEIALSELEANGMKMQLTVLDTKMDSLEVIRLLTNPALQESDLFIGPVYDNELFEVEKFCAIYKIPLVSPLRYYPNTLGADFPLINCNAADSLQSLYVGREIAKSFKKFQVILVEDNSKSTRSSSSRNFLKGYELNSGKTCKVIDGKLITPEMAWNKKDSLLIFYTNKSASSCNQAISFKTMDKVVVAGPADWLNIDRVNYSVLNDLYFYDNYSVPHNDSSYQIFRKSYRINYGGDPDRYTIIAYDQTMFFGMALMAFDDVFYKKILNKEFHYTHRTFEFIRRGNLIENAGMNLFYFKDYNFYKALWRH